MNHKKWSKASLIELTEYIEQHHRQMEEKFLKLQNLLDNATEQNKDETAKVLSSLREFFPGFKTQMERHFASEEQILIPYIRQMDEFEKNRGPKPQIHTGSVKNPISRMEYEHDLTESVMFNKIHIITGNYHLPPDSDEALSAIYEVLKDIQISLSQHIHLENNVLFPLTIELELQLMHKK